MVAAGANTAQPALLPVGTVWVGPELNWIGRMSLQSFLHRGHRVTLFCTEGIKDPQIEGLELMPVREIWDYPEDLLDHVSPTVFSDFFRLRMIRDAGMIWADTDVFCYRPFIPQDGYLAGYEHGGMINNAVLHLPASSPALNELITLFSDPSYVPEWLRPAVRREAQECLPEHRLHTACKLIPTAAGPRAMTFMLEKHGEHRHARPTEALNPLPWGFADAYFNPQGGVEGWLSEDTRAVHLYSSRIRALHKRVRPLRGSFIDCFADEIGFDLDACGLNRNTNETLLN